jgi:hypothetical protein
MHEATVRGAYNVDLGVAANHSLKKRRNCNAYSVKCEQTNRLWLTQTLPLPWHSFDRKLDSESNRLPNASRADFHGLSLVYRDHDEDGKVGHPINGWLARNDVKTYTTLDT